MPGPLPGDISGTISALENLTVWRERYLEDSVTNAVCKGCCGNLWLNLYSSWSEGIRLGEGNALSGEGKPEQNLEEVGVTQAK